MKGDFTRDSFNANGNYLRVLQQQGRVQIDADWNEQGQILWNYLQTLSLDILGPHWGRGDSFKIERSAPVGGQAASLTIGAGRYYVYGLPCTNHPRVSAKSTEPGRLDTVNTAPTAANIENVHFIASNLLPFQLVGSVEYHNQPYLPLDADAALPEAPFLVYLDVWERHLTYIEDPRIAETALEGVDTAARSQLVWQVKTATLSEEGDWVSRIRSLPEDNYTTALGRYASFLQLLVPSLPSIGSARLEARAKQPDVTNDPCVINAQARYRGLENRLYRVEIHTGGQAKDATFKWSRDNGSVVFPVVSIAGRTVTLAHLGRDATLSLQPGDWVEVVDDDYVLLNLAPPLLQVQSVSVEDYSVTLNADVTAVRTDTELGTSKHPLLRRWDHRGGDPKRGGLTIKANGAAQVIEPTEVGESWLELEDGVQIRFRAGGRYATGDYWLIPARTATADIEWPPAGQERVAAPRGVAHYYAPLAAIDENGNVVDCRRLLTN